MAISDSSPNDVPNALELFERLDAIAFEELDQTRILRGLRKHQTAHLYLPAAALVLVAVTSMGALMGLHIALAFVIACVVAMILAVGADQNEKKWLEQAKQVQLQRCQSIEGESGLVPHFVRFLPKNYHPLAVAVYQQRSFDPKRYIEVASYLTRQLDRDVFERYWHKKHGFPLSGDVETAQTHKTPLGVA